MTMVQSTRPTKIETSNRSCLSQGPLLVVPEGQNLIFAQMGTQVLRTLSKTKVFASGRPIRIQL